MPGLDLLDVAISLVFLYLLISLIATTLIELVENFLNKRSAFLLEGMKEMLGSDGQGLVAQVYNHPMIFSLFRGEFKDGGSNLPSYIPSRKFATALLDIVVQRADGVGTAPLGIQKIRESVDQLPDGQLKSALTAILNKAGDDVEQVRAELAAWYDDSMQRVSGWYQRHTRMVALVVGFLVAASLNADTVGISANLSRDRAMREAFVAVAQGYAQRPAPATANADQDFSAFLDEVQKKTPSAGVPLGWNEMNPLPTGIWAILSKLAGLFLTAAATTLGASFWFDLLKKLINVRSTVKPEPVPAATPATTGQ